MITLFLFPEDFFWSDGELVIMDKHVTHRETPRLNLRIRSKLRVSWDQKLVPALIGEIISEKDDKTIIKPTQAMISSNKFLSLREERNAMNQRTDGLS